MRPMLAGKVASSSLAPVPGFTDSSETLAAVADSGGKGW